MKFKRYPVKELKNFPKKKSHCAEQKPKEDPLISPCFWKHRNFLWFSARLEPTLSCFSGPRKLAGQKVWKNEQKKWPISNWQKKN